MNSNMSPAPGNYPPLRRGPESDLYSMQVLPKKSEMSYGAACIPQETCLNNVQLAVAYVPFQKYCSVMLPMESLAKGTTFEELYSPYSKREFGKLEPELTSRNCADDGGYQYGKR